MAGAGASPFQKAQPEYADVAEVEGLVDAAATDGTAEALVAGELGAPPGPLAISA
jgi:hypothetical protein